MFFVINRLVFHRNSTTSGALEVPFVSLPAENHGSRGAGEGGDKVIERSSSGLTNRAVPWVSGIQRLERCK